VEKQERGSSGEEKTLEKRKKKGGIDKVPWGGLGKVQSSKGEIAELRGG